AIAEAFESESLTELEAELLGAEQDLALARQEAAEIDSEAALRSERRKKIPELLAAAKDKLLKLEASSPPPAGASAELVDARARLEELRRQALETEVRTYQSELASYDARGLLLGKRRDRATLRIDHYEGRSAALRDAIKQRQRIDADDAVRAARDSLAAADAVPPAVRAIVRELGEQNERLASLRTGDEGLVEKIDDISRKLVRAEQQVAEVDLAFTNIAERIEAVGLLDSVGLLLRNQRGEAVDVGKYRRFIRMRRELIGAVQLQQIELRQRRRSMASVDLGVQRALAALDDSVPADQRGEVEGLLRELYELQRVYVDALIADYEAYFQKLVDFDATQQQLIDRTEQLLSYIDQRILWVPSSDVARTVRLVGGREALRWLFAPYYLRQLPRALSDAAARLPLLNLAVFALLAASIAFAGRARARIAALGAVAHDASCFRYGPTLEALVLVVLLSSALPASLTYLAWALDGSPAAAQYARSIAAGLLASSLLWLSLRLVRAVVQPGGIAEIHFAWPSADTGRLWRHLRWLTAVTVPAAFVIFVFEARGEELWKESLGRLAFLVSLVAVTAFTYAALGPRGSMIAILSRVGPLWTRPWARRAALVSGLAAPVLLGVGTLRGYYWTSLQLGTRQHFTLVFLFAVLVVYAMCARWALVAGRRVASAARSAGRAVEEAEGLRVAQFQASRLLRGGAAVAIVVGLFGIWADVLPAAGILRDVQLWHTTHMVNVTVTDASGGERLTSERQVVAITLADLFLALLIVAGATAAARNLPGLLEVSLLRRLGPGERYACASIVKYAVTLAGITLAFDAVGVGWSSIQWLVAAVGLGLGFGLQEIFANFISGLIILFERPIRVGDTVTVGDISGTVTRIRIRATWITGFNRKELVVPNKEFVTGRLVNWSLTDGVLRVEIPVGVAYGSDVERALELLRGVAADNQDVLKDPPPQALFLGFGDSSLSLELRTFSPDVAHVVPIRHHLHLAIDRAFRDAGIQIAFPQRDIHVRSMPADWRAVPVPPKPAGTVG
ncbi:MAG: mechanosensitive ion channel, partial [Myxococcales bacterium]